MPAADLGGSVRSTPPWRSLAHLHPDLAAELHPTRNGKTDPSELAAGSKRKLWWLCAGCGQEWQATVDNRVGRGAGCPTCAIQRRANRQSPVGRERSLAVNRPDLAGELHPTLNANLDIPSVATYSTRRLWWRCSRCGHGWQATPANRSRGGTGCPVCWAKRRGVSARTVPYQRSLVARHPELAAEPDHDPRHPARARRRVEAATHGGVSSPLGTSNGMPHLVDGRSRYRCATSPRNLAESETVQVRHSDDPTLGRMPAPLGHPPDHRPSREQARQTAFRARCPGLGEVGADIPHRDAPDLVLRRRSTSCTG